MNASFIKSFVLAFSATFVLSACDVDEDPPSELRSLVNEHADAELSYAELEQLVADATVDQYASADQTASDDYDECVDECNDAFYACEYDFFLACVYQEPSCGYEEVCEIYLGECLDDCDNFYGLADVGNGTGFAAETGGGTGDPNENEGGTGEPAPSEASAGTGEPTPDETGNGSGEPEPNETGNGSGEPEPNETGNGSGTP